MMLRQLCSVASLTLLLTIPISVKAQKCYGESVKPNSTVQELMKELRSDYWPRVWDAELRLKSRQAEAIPALIELTKSGQFVRLRETWDLIYPGAKTFYGHGYIVDYDIDWISVRAGWVLENVTFQNFGFSEGAIDHDTMFKATLAGKADEPLQDVVKLQQDPGAQQRLRTAAAERAENWWKQKGADWNRHTALIEVLTSQDPIRAERAMNWVRNGTTRCEGFKREFVKSRILAVTNNNLAAEMEEFRNWLVEMEKEKKDDFFYKSRSEDACY